MPIRSDNAELEHGELRHIESPKTTCQYFKKIFDRSISQSFNWSYP